MTPPETPDEPDERPRRRRGRARGGARGRHPPPKLRLRLRRRRRLRTTEQLRRRTRPRRHPSPPRRAQAGSADAAQAAEAGPRPSPSPWPRPGGRGRGRGGGRARLTRRAREAGRGAAAREAGELRPSRRPRRGDVARSAIRICRRRWSGRRPNTFVPRLARPGWSATTSGESPLTEARAILALTPRAIAQDWSKLLESAVANAEHNHELVGEDLYVKSVHADEGPTIKRFRPRAMGRATPIRKRTSHLTILLTPKD